MTMQSPPSPSPEMPGYSPAGPPPARGTNTMAVLALVFAFIFSPLGIVFGIIGRKQIKQTGEGGRGLATAGLVIGILGILAGVLAIVLALVGAAAAVSDLPQTPTGATSSQQSSQPTDPGAGAGATAVSPEAVAAQIEGQTQGRATGASCPSPLPAQVGASVQCTASVDGSEQPVTATVTSVQGGTVAFDITG